MLFCHVIFCHMIFYSTQLKRLLLSPVIIIILLFKQVNFFSLTCEFLDYLFALTFSLINILKQTKYLLFVSTRNNYSFYALKFFEKRKNKIKRFFLFIKTHRRFPSQKYHRFFFFWVYLEILFFFKESNRSLDSFKEHGYNIKADSLILD